MPKYVKKRHDLGENSPNSVLNHVLYKQHSRTVAGSRFRDRADTLSSHGAMSKSAYTAVTAVSRSAAKTRKNSYSSVSSDDSTIPSDSPRVSTESKKRGWTLVKGKDGKLHKRRRREKWNDHEHDLFIEGMKRFKRNWKLIAKHVGTKSAVQVRTHAYSHFNRRVLNTNGSTIPKDIIKKVWRNNIEEIPRDPFEILQQNEALASRQLNSGEPVSPRSATTLQQQSSCLPSNNFSSSEEAYPYAKKDSGGNMAPNLVLYDVPDPVELKEEYIKRLLVEARKQRLENWYHSKSFPPYPVSSYDIGGGHSMAFRLRLSLCHR